MSDWALTQCERQEISSAVASRGAAAAKGSYVQLTAATGFAYSSITVQLAASGGGADCYLVDIAIGAAASEVVIIPNILLDSNRAALNGVASINLPLAIPAGTRIAARCQELLGAGTRTVDVAVIGRAGGANANSSSNGMVTTYGANLTTTTGVLVDPGGTANTFGAWAEITSGTSVDHNGLITVLGTNQSAGSLVDSMYRFQLAIGASGSEIVIAEHQSPLTSSFNRFGTPGMDIAAQIPAGTRLAMRSKCVSSATAAARNPTAIILGY